MKKLYIALLGESSENELVENHRVVYVVAENVTQAKKLAKTKRNGQLREHILMESKCLRKSMDIKLVWKN